MTAMKSLAVVAVATGVTCAELVQLRQERDESFRSFAARVRGKAETCAAYTAKCTCDRQVDFTDIIIRDVLLAGIADMDIRREVLGTSNVLEQSVNDVVVALEQKNGQERLARIRSRNDIRQPKRTHTGPDATNRGTQPHVHLP